ncbi:MAG: hypothetical protein ACXVH2_09725 [Methanobacterium sp.]
MTHWYFIFHNWKIIFNSENQQCFNTHSIKQRGRLPYGLFVIGGFLAACGFINDRFIK